LDLIDVGVMSRDFVLNDYVCSHLYDQIGSVWIRLDHGGISIVCSKNNDRWGGYNTNLCDVIKGGYKIAQLDRKKH